MSREGAIAPPSSANNDNYKGELPDEEVDSCRDSRTFVDSDMSPILFFNVTFRDFYCPSVAFRYWIDWTLTLMQYEARIAASRENADKRERRRLASHEMQFQQRRERHFFNTRHANRGGSARATLSKKRRWRDSKARL